MRKIRVKASEIEAYVVHESPDITKARLDFLAGKISYEEFAKVFMMGEVTFERVPSTKDFTLLVPDFERN